MKYFTLRMLVSLIAKTIKKNLKCRDLKSNPLYVITYSPLINPDFLNTKKYVYGGPCVTYKISNAAFIFEC